MNLKGFSFFRFGSLLLIGLIILVLYLHHEGTWEEALVVFIAEREKDVVFERREKNLEPAELIGEYLNTKNSPADRKKILKKMKKLDVAWSDEIINTARRGGLVDYPPELVGFLLQNGLNPNTKRRGGISHLHEAAYRSNREIAEVLIAARADMAALDDQGRSPMMIAYEQNHKEFIDFLIAKGAPLDDRVRMNKKNLFKGKVIAVVRFDDGSFLIATESYKRWEPVELVKLTVREEIDRSQSDLILKRFELGEDESIENFVKVVDTKIDSDHKINITYLRSYNGLDGQHTELSLSFDKNGNLLP